MNRKSAIANIRIAGYHNDHRSMVRIYTEHRISLAVAREAFELGEKQKAGGMKCGCPDCNRVVPS